MRAMYVDGYNVIRSTHLYDNVKGDDFTGAESGLNAAREALVSDVASFAKGYYDVTIVFDGKGNPNSLGIPRKMGGINVVFSRGGQTADAVIEKLVHNIRETAEEVVVVTSDATVQWTVLGENVTRMSSANFAEEIGRIRTIAQDDMDILVGKKKNTIADRLDPETLAKLEKLAHRDDE